MAFEKISLRGILALPFLLSAAPAFAQLTPGSMDVHWDEGAPDCATYAGPPLQVHRYNDRTVILRENLCATFEAPFIYLLIGSARALLIDTGDVADPARMPLAKTVMSLLPLNGPDRIPLLVVHTHRHLDHRAGDPQFLNLPRVQVVGFDLNSVRRYYSFGDWPKSPRPIDLGGRVIDAIPTPGHNETEVSFYDRETGLFFSGDFLMPARLLIDDKVAYLASARRVSAFLALRPVSYVLGGHIEMDSQSRTFQWESQYHPHEHVLQMKKDDLSALPAAISEFNGFYTESGGFVLMNPSRILVGLAILSGMILIGMGWITISYLRRRRTRRTANDIKELPHK